MAFDPESESASQGAKWFIVLMHVLALLSLMYYAPAYGIVLSSTPFDLFRFWEHPLGRLVALTVIWDILHISLWRSNPGFYPQGPRSRGPVLYYDTSDEDREDDAAEAANYCKQCDIAKPLRAKHCYQCGRCVNKFDHHCFWLNTCIGAKNHRAFLILVIVVFVESSYLGALTYDVVDFSGNHDFLWLLRRNVVPAWCCIFGFGMACFTGVLVVIHTFLAFTGQTTYELLRGDKIPYLRKRRGGRRRASTTTFCVEAERHPYDKGILGNIHSFCCRTQVDWPVDENEHRQRCCDVGVCYLY